jgi:hypothetical protein
MVNGKKSHIYSSSYSEKAGRLNAKFGCIVFLPTGKKYLLCTVKGKREGSMDAARQVGLFLDYIHDTDGALGFNQFYRVDKVTFTFSEGKL